MSSEKLATVEEGTREKTRAVYLKIGWLSNDDQVLTLLKNGIPAFREKIAMRIYTEHGGETLLNRCPKCQGLTRSPLAKQCRYCAHDWHN